MGFDDRLITPLIAVRTIRSDAIADRDEYGQPMEVATVLTPFRGLVQPKDVRETAAISQAGVAIADHTVYARPLELIGGDFIAHADPDDETAIDTTDPRRYEITGIRDAAGLGHHLEIDARLVIAEGDTTGVGS